MDASGINGYPLVSVRWKDAHSEHGWAALVEINHLLAPCSSIGWKIHETDESVTLAATHSEGSWNDVQVIPKVLIVSQTTLQPGGLSSGEGLPSP